MLDRIQIPGVPICHFFWLAMFAWELAYPTLKETNVAIRYIRLVCSAVVRYYKSIVLLVKCNRLRTLGDSHVEMKNAVVLIVPMVSIEMIYYAFLVAILIKIKLKKKKPITCFRHLTRPSFKSGNTGKVSLLSMFCCCL